MQNNGLTNYSSFLVWSGLEKGFNYECDHYWAVNNHFPMYLAIFGMVTPEQPNKQTTSRVIQEQACLLLIGEKAVFCNLG